MSDPNTTTTTIENPFRTERSDSTSSTSSSSSVGSTGNGGTSRGEVSSTSGRRGSHGLFEGLAAQKHHDDPVSIARRRSMQDQRPPMGFIGQMWNNWVRGNPTQK